MKASAAHAGDCIAEHASIIRPLPSRGHHASPAKGREGTCIALKKFDTGIFGHSGEFRKVAENLEGLRQIAAELHPPRILRIFSFLLRCLRLRSCLGETRQRVSPTSASLCDACQPLT